MKKHTLAKIAMISCAVAVFGFGFARPASAVQNEKSASLNPHLTKYLEVSGGHFGQDMSFGFDVKPGTPVSGTPAIYAGPEGGVQIGMATFKETEKTFTDNQTLSSDASIAVNAKAFQHPGIYVYDVSENMANPVKGVTYDADVLHLYVQVVNGTSGLQIAGYWFAKDTDPLTKVVGAFTNSYVEGEGENHLHNLTVKKVVKGNMGDMTKKFTFTVSAPELTNPDDVLTVTQGSTTQKLKAGGSVTVELANGESLVVKGASTGDQIRVVENNYASDGYATVNGNKTTTMANTDEAYDVTNTKDIATPTGLFLEYGPYCAIVAGAVFLISLSRKRKEQD